ncbi:MAG: hypothetical protein AB7O97_07985 [Planctomycetota bacterium]
MILFGRRVSWAAVSVVLLGCGAAPPPAAVEVRSWGTMREVLREGRSEGRVAPAAVTGASTIGVGALESLAGEVTILDGRALVATAAAGDARCAVRPAAPTERAALLLVADVPRWTGHAVGPCASYDDLERAIAALLTARGHDLTRPVPVRVRGRARELALHVIAGACPVATPDGPPPWRHRAPAAAVELVGVFVDGGAGRFTHHGRRSHLHAVAGAVMGHLDAVVLDDAVVSLPAP